MKIEIDTGREIEVFIKWINSGCTWLQIDEFTVGFGSRQLADFVFVCRRIEIVCHIEFAVPDGDAAEWWAATLTALREEFDEGQRDSKVIKPSKAKVKVRAAVPDSEDWEE